ncbi:hypothetical protein QQ045_001286 [Rhodiola kirilowii]
MKGRPDLLIGGVNPAALRPKRIPLLSADRSSCTAHLPFRFEVTGANGRTGEDWKRLLPYVRSRLGGDCIGKGTGSFRKRRNKTHTLCVRCGRRSFHLQKSRYSACAYPAARTRKYNWSAEAIRVHAYCATLVQERFQISGIRGGRSAIPLLLGGEIHHGTTYERGNKEGLQRKLEEDAKVALTSPLRKVGDAMFCLFRYTPDYNHRMESATTSKWVRLPSIHPAFVTKNYVAGIVNSFGYFLDLDERSKACSTLKYVRACVEIDVRNTILDEVGMPTGSKYSNINVVEEWEIIPGIVDELQEVLAGGGASLAMVIYNEQTGKNEEKGNVDVTKKVEEHNDQVCTNQPNKEKIDTVYPFDPNAVPKNSIPKRLNIPGHLGTIWLRGWLN